MQFSPHELEKLTMSVQEMFLASGAQKAAHALKFLEYKHGAVFVGQLLCFTPQELLQSHYIGAVLCIDIIEVLAENGLRVASLEDYKQELIHDVWLSCPKLPEEQQGMENPGIIDMNKVKAKKAFATYLCSLNQEFPPLHSGLKEWFNHYIANPAVRGTLERPFTNSVLSDSVPVGRIGLSLNNARPEPRMA